MKMRKDEEIEYEKVEIAINYLCPTLKQPYKTLEEILGNPSAPPLEPLACGEYLL